MKNSVVCVTGGVGAIGINLVIRLLAEGVEKVVVIDNLSSGQKSFLPSDERIVFYYVDIFRYDELLCALSSYSFDYVFHLAAHFANQNSVEHPISDIQTNIVGTVNLLEILKTQKKLKKVIYASSSCLYGESEHMSELSCTYPYETPYAINKYASELYIKYYAEMFEIPTISIRIFNTFGPYEVFGAYRNVIPKFVHKALLSEDILITGDGFEIRDFTYIDDTVELFILAALSNVVDGRFFNGGTGKETKIIDLANLILEYCDSDSRIVHCERRKWDKVSYRVSNIELSQSVLGYNPRFDIRDGLLRYIEWYRRYLDV